MSFGEHCARRLASWSFSPRASLARVALCRVVLVLMTVSVALLGVFEVPASTDERPNILFFFTDDQPHDALGAAGHPILQTPHLDRLAEQGVRFSHAFVSTSICWVSRATVLTGHSFQAFRGRENSLRLEYQLPQEKWVHVAAVKRGPEVTVYLGGEPVAAGELLAELPSLPFFLGGDPHANELSTCDLDDVRLYRQALSADQIRQQATAPSDAPESPDDETSLHVGTEALRNVLPQ